MRSVWKGAISFLLVSIPVKVYNAIETSEKISFNHLHAGDCLGNIGHTKECKKCGEVVSNEQIAKGYQYEKEKYVLVTAEEISSITPDSNERIDIIGFITPEEIPTTYLDASYFAAPDGAAAGKAYAVLRDIMKRTARIAIGKVILREREELITVSPDGDGIIIRKLHYRHEVRNIESVPGVHNLPTTNDNELAIAEKLVENMITTFEEIDTEDHYHSALKEMLEKKVSGGTVTINNEKSKPAETLDIMSALLASLKATPQSKQEPSAPVSATEPSPAQTTLIPMKPYATASRKRKTA